MTVRIVQRQDSGHPRGFRDHSVAMKHWKLVHNAGDYLFTFDHTVEAESAFLARTKFAQMLGADPMSLRVEEAA